MFSFLNQCAQYLTIIMINWQPMSLIFDWNGHRHGTGETFKNIMIVIQTEYALKLSKGKKVAEQGEQ